MKTFLGTIRKLICRAQFPPSVCSVESRVKDLMVAAQSMTGRSTSGGFSFAVAGQGLAHTSQACALLVSYIPSS